MRNLVYIFLAAILVVSFQNCSSGGSSSSSNPSQSENSNDGPLGNSSKTFKGISCYKSDLEARVTMVVTYDWEGLTVNTTHRPNGRDVNEARKITNCRYEMDQVFCDYENEVIGSLTITISDTLVSFRKLTFIGETEGFSFSPDQCREIEDPNSTEYSSLGCVREGVNFDCHLNDGVRRVYD